MIDPEKLTDEQYAGNACVVNPSHPGFPGVQVGFLGPDNHPVYACLGRCARQLDALVMERVARYSVDRSGTSSDASPDRSTVLSGVLWPTSSADQSANPPADWSAVPSGRTQ